MPLAILLLYTAFSGTLAASIIYSAHCCNGRQRRSAFYFCAMLRRAPAQPEILILHAALLDTFRSHFSTNTLCLATAYRLGQSTLSLPAAVTTTCHLQPLPSPTTWCSHHHLASAVASTYHQEHFCVLQSFSIFNTLGIYLYYWLFVSIEYSLK